MPLTPKQESFIKEYLHDFNATAAAERAGYKGSRTTLATVGSENLARPEIRDRINQALAEWAMSAREVLYRLSERARGSMGDFLSETPGGDVRINLKKALQTGAMDQVKYFAHDERWDQDRLVRNRFEISLHDALSALTQLSRAYNLSSGALTDSEPDPEDIATASNLETPQEILTTFLTAVRNVIAWEDENFGPFDLDELDF